MISVFYCTRESNPKYVEHIKSTCGLRDVEVIEYVNNGEGLTKPYNKGLKESKYDITVFIHDDLILPKDNWGKKLLKRFKDSDYGILGVAGTTKLHETGMWWMNRELMIGCVKHLHEGKLWENKYSYNNDYGIVQTVIVDGLFMAVDKTRIKKGFDEDFEGFHFYDIPFCVANHLEGVKIGVIYDVRLTHKSIGMISDDWDRNRMKFQAKYNEYNGKTILPLEIGGNLTYSEKPVYVKKEPKLSLIIPTKGKLDLLFGCVDSIFEKSAYKNLTVHIADTGSSDEEKKQIKEKYGNNEKVNLIEYDYYNFSDINNDVVVNHVSEDTELILFCNNDIKLLNDAISKMVNTYLANKNCGTVGARLHFADGKVQHDGIICWVDEKKIIRITHRGINSWYNYYDGIRENIWGSTGAFLLLNRKLFLKMNGFIHTSECFEDVILNINVGVSGFKNYVVGDAVCYHYESQSRNEDPDKNARENKDYNNLVVPLILKHKDKLFPNVEYAKPI